MCILVWVDHTGANHDLTSFIYDIYHHKWSPTPKLYSDMKGRGKTGIYTKPCLPFTNRYLGCKCRVRLVKLWLDYS